MDIFISWSGPKSHAVASALHKWLPKIVNAFKPWLSSADIDKGTRWRSDIAGRLQQARAGIICLTPSNLHADWILFEAGALSKQIENTFVCTLLIGLEPTDVKDPLAQFQATRLDKKEILGLLKTLNNNLGDEKLTENHVEEAFEVWWPKLESDFKTLPNEDVENKTGPPRSERDLLEEILSLVRAQVREAEMPPSTIDLISETVTLAVPNLNSASVGYGTGGYSVGFTIGDKRYTFSIPKMPYTKIRSAVLSELEKAMRANAPSQLGNHSK